MSKKLKQSNAAEARVERSYSCMKDLFVIKATNRQTGESWFVYDGNRFNLAMAELTAKDCNRMWPGNYYEVLPAKGSEAKHD